MNPFSFLYNLVCSYSPTAASTPLHTGPNALILLGYLLWNNSKSKRRLSEKSSKLRRLISCQTCQSDESQEILANKSFIIPTFRETTPFPILTASETHLLPDSQDIASQYEFVDAKKIRSAKKSPGGKNSRKAKTPVKRLQNRYELRKKR